MLQKKHFVSGIINNNMTEIEVSDNFRIGSGLYYGKNNLDYRSFHPFYGRILSHSPISRYRVGSGYP